MICGLDPLRDEALIYERILREECGVTTMLQVYPGVPHGFHNFFSELKVAQKYMKDAVDAVGWLLEQGKTWSEATKPLLNETK